MATTLKLLTLLWLSALTALSAADDWQTGAPREEIAPQFSQEDSTYTIQSTGEEGQNGYWYRHFPVTGGEWMEFSALRLAEGIESPRRSVLVRLVFQDDAGNLVTRQEPTVMHYFVDLGEERARPEYPRDRGEVANGWVKLSDRYLVPQDATQARVELHLRWAPQGKVTWKDVRLEPSEPREKRLVKLAAAHLNPTGGESPAENLKLFAPLIAEASAQEADLICLPEYITTKGLKLEYAEASEPVPGPSTDYLGSLARQHDIYVVASIVEREAHLIYNTAVLMGPDGALVGKYRKVTLPREEIASGVCPGDEYPVFDTRFGKVGMMVCYDVFYPEVARKLSRNGAEVIAMPIWGGNPLLASARACENHVYLVTSTYTDSKHEWMKSGIWDREGALLQHATEWGTVVVQEVDLNQPTVWRGLGDFQSRINREAPEWGELD